MPGALRHSGRAYLVTFSTTGLKPRNVTYYDPLIGQTTLDGISKVLVVSDKKYRSFPIIRYNSRESRTLPRRTSRPQAGNFWADFLTSEGTRTATAEEAQLGYSRSSLKNTGCTPDAPEMRQCQTKSFLGDLVRLKLVIMISGIL